MAARHVWNSPEEVAAISRHGLGSCLNWLTMMALVIQDVAQFMTQ